jgi:hypothetical protein
MSTSPHPDQITPKLRELDLSPFVLGEVAGLRLRKPVSLLPYLSENQQLICLDHEPWDLQAFAPTRGELFDELKDELRMLWLEFAQEDDLRLSEPAQRLKQQLLSDWEEIGDAQGQA